VDGLTCLIFYCLTKPKRLTTIAEQKMAEQKQNNFPEASL
jgi:hypothetical protein